MSRLSAIVVMPPDELHAKPWKRLVEVHANGTYDARHPINAGKIMPAYDVTGPDPRVPVLSTMHVVWPVRVAPPKRAKGLPGGSAWWRLEMEALGLKRKQMKTPTALDRRRANRNARRKAKRAAYIEAVAERDMALKLGWADQGGWTP